MTSARRRRRVAERSMPPPLYLPRGRRERCGGHAAFFVIGVWFRAIWGDSRGFFSIWSPEVPSAAE